MRSRARRRPGHSGWTSSTRHNAKSRDRRRKPMILAPLKRKRASRTKQAFVLEGFSCSVEIGGRMTDLLAPVLIPYARFLEYRDRRPGIAAERILIPQDGPCAVDGVLLPAMVPNDEREPDAARVPQAHSATGVQKP